jgi:hypothetical protein
MLETFHGEPSPANLRISDWYDLEDAFPSGLNPEGGVRCSASIVELKYSQDSRIAQGARAL